MISIRRTAFFILWAYCLVSVQGPVLAAEGSWKRAAEMPTARSEIAVAEMGGRIYVAGGITLFGTTDTFEVYDPQKNSWRTLASLPEGRHHLGMAALKGRIYVAGGYADLSFTPDRKSAWVYDVATNGWQPIADMPQPRAAHRMVALEGRLYVVGGVGPDPIALWAYNPAQNKWQSTLEPLPTAREHLATVAAHGKLHVIAGRWRDKNLRVVEAYDPLEDSWHRLADLPLPRGALTAAVLGGRIHVTGGEDLGSSDTFADHWIYDRYSDRWIERPAMPTARHGLDSAAIGLRWYVIGGGRSAGMKTFFTLSDANEIFTEE